MLALVEAMFHFWDLSQTVPTSVILLASNHSFFDFTAVAVKSSYETILLFFC